MTEQTKHLDIGCGDNPRNPFSMDYLYGVDIQDLDQKKLSFEYKKDNVVLNKLPFPDSFFDSVSCFDFLEHVPRVLIEKNKSKFPFIELMNEIHRVLKNGGIFYGITPGYPKEEAFLDPTHVNFITFNTHKYFVAPKYKAKMYGYTGSFQLCTKVRWVRLSQELEKNYFLKLLKGFFYFFLPRKRSHILWKFKAIKNL